MTPPPRLEPVRRTALVDALSSVGIRFEKATWNEFSSTFDSYLVEGKDRALFVKFGEGYTDANTGHRRGVEREIDFYTTVAATCPQLPTRVVHSMTGSGEAFLVP